MCTLVTMCPFQRARWIPSIVLKSLGEWGRGILACGLIAHGSHILWPDCCADMSMRYSGNECYIDTSLCVCVPFATRTFMPPITGRWFVRLTGFVKPLHFACTVAVAGTMRNSLNKPPPVRESCLNISVRQPAHKHIYIKKKRRQ